MKVTNLFNDEELRELHYLIDNSEDLKIQDEYGRLCITSVTVPSMIQNKLNSIVKERYRNFTLEVEKSPLCVIYSKEYGEPNLPPHWDGDNTEVIVNFQLDSRLNGGPWLLGLDEDVYELEDNEALIFNPNLYVHWRAKREFEDGEFVKMVFFRFRGDKSRDLDFVIDNPIFEAMNNMRDEMWNKSNPDG